jgi:glycogen(starch) synthase
MKPSRPGSESDAYPPLSIIINTDGRAAILGNTIESLRYLRYPNLELVVVPGPTADGTRELLDREWRGAIKLGTCPTRNIAQSRNIGIELASGEIIAFVDDDEIPEPEWLEDLVPRLQDHRVAVAGGWLIDHTGKDYQARFDTVDRLGNANHSWERATPEFNFPLSFNVPHAMINSAFRRAALVDVGGFDEEFEYLLDETDLMVRFVDRGWRVVQTDRGFVHHKFLPSAIRNKERVLTSWYSVIKSKTYFAFLHGDRFVSMDRILGSIGRFVDAQRTEVHDGISHGVLAADADRRFEQEADRAVRDGMRQALSGRRRLGDPRRLAGDPAGFLSFPTRLPPARQRCFVLLSEAYPPAPAGAIGGHVHRLARALAAEGHQVHVLTCGAGHDRVDFEDGIWVHRLLVRDFPAPVPDGLDGLAIPPDVWNCSLAMLREAEEIARRRPVCAVRAPLASAAAIAFLRDGKWPLVTSLDRDDPASPPDGAALPAVARLSLARSAGIVASGATEVAAIEAAYGTKLDRNRLAVISGDRTAREVAFLVALAEGQVVASDGKPYFDENSA